MNCSKPPRQYYRNEEEHTTEKKLKNKNVRQDSVNKGNFYISQETEKAPGGTHTY